MPQDHNRSLLRSATLSDLREVASWIRNKRECELWAGRRLGFPIDHGSLPTAIGFADGNAFSLAIHEDLVAFGQIGKNSRRGHLARLIVNPASRGRGYGRTLVRTLLDKARGSSFERVSLNVDIANVAAVSLYTKLGFVDMKKPPDEPGGFESRYMEMLI